MSRKTQDGAVNAARLRRIVQRFPRTRILVVGDLMLDQFIWGRVDRISPEAPVPVVKVTGESMHLGGAANVVHNIRALGGAAAACGVIGRDLAGRRVLQELRRIGAKTAGVASSSRAVTVRKTRIIAHSQQVVRFDHEQTDQVGVASMRLLRFLQHHVGDYDLVVISDYGKGVIGEGLLETLHAAQARKPLRIILDPKDVNFGHYRRVTLATPNLSEASEAAGVKIRDERTLNAAGQRLLERWDAEAILITRGEEGMTLFTRPQGVCHFPTVARQVFDVTGAGDTVVAACAQALAAGASFDEAAFLANHAAGVVVGKVGTATVTESELRHALDL